MIPRNIEIRRLQIGALWKACTHSESNRNAILANGLRVIEALAEDKTSAEVARAATGLLLLLQQQNGEGREPVASKVKVEAEAEADNNVEPAVLTKEKDPPSSASPNAAYTPVVVEQSLHKIESVD